MLLRFALLVLCLVALVGQGDVREALAPAAVLAQAEATPPAVEPPGPGPAPAELWNYAILTPTPSDEAVANMLIVWADADPEEGEAPLTVKFRCEPLEDEVVSPSFEWDFGDGSPKVKGESATHTYTKPGTYTARVVVTDIAGGRGTDEVEIEVVEPEGPKKT